MGIKKKTVRNKFLCVWMIVSFFVLGLPGCFSLEKEEKEKASYGWCSYGNAPFEDGVLALTGRVWVFDREAEQMVPLCTRPECTHEYNWSATAKESDCPASYLGRRATALAVYEGQIWYVYQNEDTWEFWTAELDGENHTLQQKADMGVLTPGPESLFYDGSYYTVATDLVEDLEAGEHKLMNRLVQVDLGNGEVKELTEPVDVSENPELLGAYGDHLYYTQVVTDESGKLVRNIYQLSQDNGEAEILDRGSWCELNGQWLAYVGKRDNGRGEICLRDLKITKKVNYAAFI